MDITVFYTGTLYAGLFLNVSVSEYDKMLHKNAGIVLFLAYIVLLNGCQILRILKTSILIRVW